MEDSQLLDGLSKDEHVTLFSGLFPEPHGRMTGYSERLPEAAASGLPTSWRYGDSSRCNFRIGDHTGVIARWLENAKVRAVRSTVPRTLKSMRGGFFD